jgi:hypothetical protein
MPDFGSGIYLTRQNDLGPVWDLQVDSSGDIRMADGEDELLKDVAYSTAVRIQPELGQRFEPVVLNRIRARVKDALQDDDRIDVVLVVDATQTDSDTLSVDAVANADDEEVELVFEVPT